MQNKSLSCYHASMKFVTVEDVANITLEELQTPVDIDWIESVTTVRDDTAAAIRARITELVPDLDVLVQQVRTQHDTGALTAKSFEHIKALPPKLVIEAWHRLTVRGIDNFDFVKHVHIHLCSCVLNALGITLK